MANLDVEEDRRGMDHALWLLTFFSLSPSLSLPPSLSLFSLSPSLSPLAPPPVDYVDYVGLAIGLSIGSFFLFIVIPVIISVIVCIVIACCVHASNRRHHVTTRVVTAAPAPATTVVSTRSSHTTGYTPAPAVYPAAGGVQYPPPNSTGYQPVPKYDYPLPSSMWSQELILWLYSNVMYKEWFIKLYVSIYCDSAVFLRRLFKC